MSERVRGKSPASHSCEKILWLVFKESVKRVSVRRSSLCYFRWISTFSLFPFPTWSFEGGIAFSWSRFITSCKNKLLRNTSSNPLGYLFRLLLYEENLISKCRNSWYWAFMISTVLHCCLLFVNVRQLLHICCTKFLCCLWYCSVQVIPSSPS